MQYFLTICAISNVKKYLKSEQKFIILKIAIDFVVKPFDYTKVTEVVARALRDTNDW